MSINEKKRGANSMKKDVLITIKGIQMIDGEEDTTELFTTGNYYLKEDTYYITYEESETTGFEGSKTTLKIAPENSVSLIRHGEMRSNLVIKEGQRNVGYYYTMQGEILIGVSGTKVKVNLDENGGDLEFRYSLDINSSHVSDNEVYVNIRESAN